MSTHEEKVVVTIESIGKAVEMLCAEVDELRAENRALSNRIEALTQATRHIQRLPSEQ